MCGIICIIKYGTKLEDRVFTKCHEKLVPRGPDKQNAVEISIPNGTVYLGFSRLAIMDTSDNGLQPFKSESGNYVICNGEIYNYEELAKKYNVEMRTKCDCEVILPLYENLGFQKLLEELSAEFAVVIYDEEKQRIYVARDKYGVRPLFYGWNRTARTYGFASEIKALHDIMEFIEPVTPNMYFCFDLNTGTTYMFPYFNYEVLFNKPNVFEKPLQGLDTLKIKLNDREMVQLVIRELLTESVKKRLHTDRPIGFLLSGGLDSSLIVAIATKILGPENITCFSIGLPDSPDVVASKTVAEYLGITKHHIIPFDVEIGINTIPEVIRTIESYDITTIRASTPQYIMAKYIATNTDIKVLLSGEGSDEIHGSYRYFRDAPNPIQFHSETVRLVKELYMFDNLRTDRTMSSNGLEVRVPFLDFDYVDFIMKLNPEFLMYTCDQMEKQIIRDSFKGYLPNEILYRSKEAFSDAVSSNEVNWFKSIQKLASETISESDLEMNLYKFNPPKTIEALYFRRIFDSFYPGRDEVISHYWLPKFQKEEVHDPSATVLSCY